MRGEKRGSYTLGYNSESTLSVLFQMKGSVWKEVIPYCLVNVSLLLISWYFQREQKLNVTRNGHQLSGIIVSFFVVIRSNTALGKYHQGRKDLGQVWNAFKWEFSTDRVLTCSRKDALSCKVARYISRSRN